MNWQRIGLYYLTIVVDMTHTQQLNNNFMLTGCKALKKKQKLALAVSS